MKISNSDSSIIIMNDFIYDTSNKRRYKMICKSCKSDRGYQRPAKRILACMSCGQVGKISGKKGIKLTSIQKNNISKGNYTWRKKQDPLYISATPLVKKIKHSLRSRLIKAIKFGEKGGSAVDDLGCTIKEFRLYVESLFQKGMTWDNWSLKGWHMDHIKPLSSFDLTNREELLKAVHYTNLQPLWAKDNLSKGSKIDV